MSSVTAWGAVLGVSAAAVLCALVLAALGVAVVRRYRRRRAVWRAIAREVEARKRRRPQQ